MGGHNNLQRGDKTMALKEQANKKKTPRNDNSLMRDGKPLEKGSTSHNEKR
jgi:hypothetical protein